MNEVILKVNGDDIPLTEFPSEIIAQTILGMLKALHGIDDDIKEINITIKVS